MKFMESFSWVLLLIVFGTLVALSVAAQNKQDGASTTSDVVSQMAVYTKQKRYDDAINVGLASEKDGLANAFILQQIAIVYLIRGQKEANQREQSVQKAVEYIDKSLSVHSNNIAGMDFYTAGRSYETAGDLSVSKRCLYYQRAAKSLKAQIPLLRGDQTTVEGKTFKFCEKNPKRL